MNKISLSSSRKNTFLFYNQRFISKIQLLELSSRSGNFDAVELWAKSIAGLDVMQDCTELSDCLKKIIRFAKIKDGDNVKQLITKLKSTYSQFVYFNQTYQPLPVKALKQANGQFTRL